MPSIIYFDGVCNLCSGFVQFVIKRDPKHYFRFASLQGVAGTLLREQHPDIGDSLVLVENGKIFTESAAALRVARRLKGGWPLCYALIIIPPFISNFFYRFIAANRYKWFGKTDQCMVPAAELQELFVD
jgi:predicted DCC family thiol-disulfide oxidoreductase YuxK